jgi:hypothetical protein
MPKLNNGTETQEILPRKWVVSRSFSGMRVRDIGSLEVQHVNPLTLVLAGKLQRNA